MSRKWYTLHLTEEQARAVSYACELAARIGMSQLDMITQGLPLATEKHSALRDLIERTERDVKPIIGLEGGAYYGIRHKAVPQTAKRAWDVHAVIRHRLSWDRAIADGIVEKDAPRNWSRMATVNYDEPDNVACEPLPTMRTA